ncbi:hypothetical protein HMPREF0372_02859 [Flavonifractor plautii ATCC 29863]|uniref:Uncharacterized protein n=1 Tax=Flavonifractor plautii ATCC 29863 TaxID=411475 RepID=G9YTK0_FLAPL|nr:hypothetical protein HMPREF0372_02859 [Flavonifractor plautii ATCC 29863]
MNASFPGLFSEKGHKKEGAVFPFRKTAPVSYSISCFYFIESPPAPAADRCGFCDLAIDRLY